VALISALLLGQALPVYAGGAITKRRQVSGQIKVQQQIQVQQKVMIQQYQAQQAAAQAAAVAQYKANQAAAQATAQVAAQMATAQQQALQQAAMTKAAVQHKVQQEIAEEAVRAKYQYDAAQVKAVATLDEVVAAMDASAINWELLIDEEAKAAVVWKYIQRYRQQGVNINKPADYYAQIIDSMSAQSPQMLAHPFDQVLRTAAIIEYDFDNGYNKDMMAEKILGSKQAMLANKQRLGIR